jgi:LmbE family N-acetylglucosaminyl deacetylase
MSTFISPHLVTKPVIVSPESIVPGDGRTLLVVVAHADDPAFFAGGVLALWARAGWRLVCLRVTDDRWDSVGLDEGETVRCNTLEFHEAAQVLGIAEVHDLGWQTDVLGDVSRVKLRERMIHAIRRFKPYGLVTFDPDSMFNEDNLDHRVVAQAVDEAFWCSQFDKHHPEHFAEGLELHGTYERWYFGRSVLSVTHVFDTTSVLETQLEAILCHKTMLSNIARQLSLQARTAGLEPSLISNAVSGAHRPLFETLLRRAASAKGAPFGIQAAEVLRLHRADLDLAWAAALQMMA